MWLLLVCANNLLEDSLEEQVYNPKSGCAFSSGMCAYMCSFFKSKIGDLGFGKGTRR